MRLFSLLVPPFRYNVKRPLSSFFPTQAHAEDAAPISLRQPGFFRLPVSALFVGKSVHISCSADYYILDTSRGRATAISQPATLGHHFLISRCCQRAPRRRCRFALFDASSARFSMRAGGRRTPGRCSPPGPHHAGQPPCRRGRARRAFRAFDDIGHYADQHTAAKDAF